VRAVIVGLNNPHSTDPEEALGTTPVGESGYRLWLMIKESANRHGKACSESDYMEGFARRNMSNATVFNDNIAKVRVPLILNELAGNVGVLCGTRVPKLLGLKYTGFHLMQQNAQQFAYYVIPHPSGLTREYNDPEMRKRVGDLMFALYLKLNSKELQCQSYT